MRKFLALVLSCVLSASAVSTVAGAAKFTDVSASDETLTKAVELLSSVGITTGTTETTFGTSENVTRQQMATFIYRLMKAGKTVEGGDNTTSFTDLDDPFYYFMVSWANDMGIIKGRNETSFDPKGKIILQDAYVMLVRALGYEKDADLMYPFGYIQIAEKIGLDDGLPSSVNYDTALTRGNVAILLYNAFYADMATGKKAYETTYEEVTLTGGKLAVVESGMEEYTVYDTVAEKIFGVKRTVQRVVATPNYSLDSFKKTDDGKNDVEIVTLECYDEDYIETDSELFSDVEFETLSKDGNADDYFLIDFSIYYKKDDGKEPEILTAVPLGSRTKEISGGKVKFETESGTSRQNYMVTSTGQSKESRFKNFTGKVTVDGNVSYLFDAPWSYSKPADISEKDKDCITLLWLDGTDRDPEEEEDYVQDFNFKSDRDVTGRGKEYYASKSVSTYYDSGKAADSYLLGDKDLRGVGLYTSWGLYMSTIIDLHMSSNYEADVWDSNGDGKIDYMWLKPYTVGQAVVKEGETFFDMHNTSEVMDKYGCIYEALEVPKIYTYGATNAGADFKEDQIIVAYVNGPANYIKVAQTLELKYETQSFEGIGADSNNIKINGSFGGRWGGSLIYIGFPNASGARPAASIDGQLVSSGPFVSKYFNTANLGKSFEIAYVGGRMFHVKGNSGVIGDKDDYAIIFPNTNGSYAYTTSVGIVTDGNLQKSGNVIDALIDGEIVSVAVKPQTSASVEKKNIPEGGTASLMPVTAKQSNGVYDFSDYVGKLLTYSINSDDEYVFKIAPFDSNNDKSVLGTEDDDVYYTYESDEDGKVTAAFVKSTGNLYQFLKKDTNSIHTAVAPSKFVSFTENTRVVIKTYDDEDEPEFKIYTYENKPNFDNSVDFRSIKYVVKNNPNSTTIEELIYLYAEAADGETSSKIDNTPEYRFVKSSKAVKVDDDEKVVYYDVYNPFTGKVEAEFEAYDETETVSCKLNGIYSLSDGYIVDKYCLGTIDNYGKVATSSTSTKATDLGLVKIADYDSETGMLAVEDTELLFKVDDDTVITFLDLDEEEISVKSDSILNSTSASFRCNDNKKMPLLAFVVSSEIKKEDEFEHAEVICIVRYNALDTTT